MDSKSGLSVVNPGLDLLKRNNYPSLVQGITTRLCASEFAIERNETNWIFCHSNIENKKGWSESQPGGVCQTWPYRPGLHEGIGNS